MTETDLLYDQLPEAVRKAFSAGEYADWRVEDAERLARAGFEPIYVLEVEKGQTEYELFYAEDGVLIRAVVDADDDASCSGCERPDTQRLPVHSRHRLRTSSQEV